MTAQSFVPDQRELASQFALLSEQATKYMDMVQRCHQGDFSSQQMQSLREQTQVVKRASERFQAIVTDPRQWIAEAAWSFTDSVALSLVLELKIHLLIDTKGTGTTLAQLSELTGASPGLIKRAMRHCIHRLIFAENSAGSYHHTPRSMLLLERDFCSLLHYIVDDGLLIGAHLARTLSKNNFRVPEDSRESAFCEAFQTPLPFYEYYHTMDIPRFERFSQAMEGRYKGCLDEPMRSTFGLASLPAGSVLVDIGGGNGHHAICLASLFPQPNCIVQEHESVVKAAYEKVRLPEDVVGRVSWEVHSYFSPQCRKSAAIYLLSHVMMDNSDRDCVRILQNIMGAMDPKASRILIHDRMDPDVFGQDRPRVFDMLDLHHLAAVNRLSRNETQWDDLIKSAGGGLRRRKTWVGDDMGVIFELGIC